MDTDTHVVKTLSPQSWVGGESQCESGWDVPTFIEHLLHTRHTLGTRVHRATQEVGEIVPVIQKRKLKLGEHVTC